MTPEVWALDDFLLRYDEWVERDQPSDDWRLAVLAWIHLLQSDPYRGATRRFDLGLSFWFAALPNAENDRTGVYALYRVSESDHRVTCDVFATLRKPVIP